MTLGRAKRTEHVAISLTLEERQTLEAMRAQSGFPTLASFMRFHLWRAIRAAKSNGVASADQRVSQQ
jgi:hypothetical protein